MNIALGMEKAKNPSFGSQKQFWEMVLGKAVAVCVTHLPFLCRGAQTQRRGRPVVPGPSPAFEFTAVWGLAEVTGLGRWVDAG